MYVLTVDIVMESIEEGMSFGQGENSSTSHRFKQFLWTALLLATRK